MPAKIISTIAARNFGFVKAVTDPNGPSEIHLANLYGLADSIVTGSSPEGQVFTGVGGQFQVDQLDLKDPSKILNSIQAGRLFFPTGIGTEIIEAAKGLRDEGKAEGALRILRFAFKVSGIRANNPAGYSWQFEPLMEAAPDSPMEAFKREVRGEALPKPEERKALAAPESAEGGEADKAPVGSDDKHHGRRK